MKEGLSLFLSVFLSFIIFVSVAPSTRPFPYHCICLFISYLVFDLVCVAPSTLRSTSISASSYLSLHQFRCFCPCLRSSINTTSISASSYLSLHQFRCFCPCLRSSINTTSISASSYLSLRQFSDVPRVKLTLF